MEPAADPDYWRRRWEEGRIGFHEGRVNAELQEFWPALDLEPGSRVLVPLCGKAHDLRWLAERGHRVVGVECSERAVAEFFDEQGLVPERSRCGPFRVWDADGLRILEGDFFALAAEPEGPAFDAWWDRAALVALPEATRERYVEHLATLLRPGARGLALVLERPDEPGQGPPFSVDAGEMRTRFAPPHFTPPRELLRREGGGPPAEDGSVPRREEVVWRLERART